MRATIQEQLGGAGQNDASADFERLGWGVARNPDHDLGTDLFLMARDERLFDLGLVIGAQVKSGATAFKAPAHDSAGGLLGWWFRDDDRRHVDAWLEHELPHLVVLHDPVTRVCYWAHVTADAVVSTGKGAKLLVPVGNTVTPSQRQALLEVAATSRPAPTWEGSTWTGAAVVLPRDQLRYALVVPRLIAPHPNTRVGPDLTPEQALGLVVQGREGEITLDEDTPPLADLADWTWRFVAAMSARATDGTADLLVACASDAPTPEGRAAATVAAAATLIEQGRADQSLPLLDAALTTDGAEPVDHAWLTVQRARALVELGRNAEAREAALRTQAVRRTHGHDPTARAIGGVAAVLLFNSGDVHEGDLEQTVTAADTTAAWWRSHVVAGGLAASLERQFGDWARRRSRYRAADVGLVSAAMTASFAGDHGSWGRLSSLFALDLLVGGERHSDPDAVAEALEELRLAGSHTELETAARAALDDGPCSALLPVLRGLELDRSTHTTAHADLALLRVAGDLLDEPSADATVAWLLSTLDDGAAFVARTRPAYLMDHALLGALGGVVPAATDTALERVAAWLATIPPIVDQLQAQDLGRVVAELAPRPGVDLSPAIARADEHQDALRWALLRAAAHTDDVARGRLYAQVRDGDLTAFPALGDVRALPGDVVQAAVVRFVPLVEGERDSARLGISSVGSTHPARDLALLSLWHPERAAWDTVLGHLADSAVAPRARTSVVRLLAALPENLPEALRPDLLGAARQVAETGASALPGSLGDVEPLHAAVAELVAALDPAAADAVLTGLLAGGTDARAAAARAARWSGSSLALGLLAALAHDDEPAVRGDAAGAAAAMVAAGTGGEVLAAVVRRAAADPSRHVPWCVAVGARAVTPVVGATAAVLDEVLDGLRRHPSAHVRRAASG